MVAERQESFGAQLRRHREAAGFSQEQLAERAGLSANAVGALERSERTRPFPDTVRRLADALGLADADRRALAAARPGRGRPAPRKVAAPATAAPPTEPTPLIGRADDVTALQRLLSDRDNRLVTLVGPGGVGKTRLALHLAHAVVADDYPDGVVWVDLAPLANAGLVLATIGQTVAAPDVAHGDAAAAVYHWFRDRHALLVLDNVEHLLDAVPDVARLLSACPRLQVLATSRSPVRVRGEQEYPVLPLESPPARPGADPRDAASFPAVRLLVWHARHRDPAFALAAEDAGHVAAICRRVDGLPLALELVAARLRVLTPAELDARLDRLLPLLVGGARDLPPRQRTMRAAVAWSEELLHPAERALFRRLAVFAGGWTLEAAEAVGAASAAETHSVLDRLDALTEQSLVTVAHGRDGTRYGMLEPVRQYALERLHEAGEEPAVRRRHADHLLALAERAAAGIEGRPGQAAWIGRLEREQDNVRAALAWCEQADDGAATGLRLATALWRFWEMRWRVEEGGRWLAGALARSDGLPADVRANALNAAGNLAGDGGQYERATAYHEECLAIRRRLGDVRGIAVSLNNLGVVARNRGDAERTRALCEESLALFRQAGDRHGAAIALISLGVAAALVDDLEGARARYEESLGLFRAEGDDWHSAWVLTYLAEVTVRTREVASARALAEEALALHRRSGDASGIASALGVLGRVDQSEGALVVAAERFAEALRHVVQAPVERAVPACLEDLAGVLLASGHIEAAARLAGAAAALRGAGSPTRVPFDPHRAAAVDALRTVAGGVPWRDGRLLARDRVLSDAAAVPGIVAAAPDPAPEPR